MDHQLRKTLQELREARDRLDKMDIPLNENRLTEEMKMAIEYYQERVADLKHQSARLAALEEGVFVWDDRGRNQHNPPVTLTSEAWRWNKEHDATSKTTRQQEIDSLLQDSGNLLGPNPPPQLRGTAGPGTAQAASAPPKRRKVVMQADPTAQPPPEYLAKLLRL